MNKYLMAVTYEICEHNDLYMDMNEYTIDPAKDVDRQLSEIAKTDAAPLVKVYECDTSDFKDCRLVKERRFKEYECNCEDGKD